MGSLLIDNHIIVVAFKEDALGMKHRVHGFVIAVVVPLLGDIGFVTASEFFECDIINTSLSGLILILDVDLEGEVGSFAPFTSGNDIEAFGTSQRFSGMSWLHRGRINATFEHLDLICQD